MANITTTHFAANTAIGAEYLKLRHKYLNGSGEIIEGAAGVLSTGTFPDGVVGTPFNCVISAKGTLLSAVASGAVRPSLILGSASEAAQFGPGDTINVFTSTTGAIAGSAMTVQSVKGQQVILNTTTDAAYIAGDLVVRFATGAVGGGTSNVTDASAGLPYVGAGDAVAFLQSVQDLLTDIAHTGTGNVNATIESVGQYTRFGSGCTVNTAGTHIGDLLTFTAGGGGDSAATTGLTARVVAHTATGGLDTFTVGDIRDSNGTLLGDQFPVTTTAAHSGGAGASVTLGTDTTFTMTSGIADKYIKQIMGSTEVPPAKVAGQENSNDSGSIMLLINAMIDMIQKLDPTADAEELVTANLEEKLFGTMVGGAVGTAQGKRLNLATTAALADTSITVEMDNAINDIPFPLSGIVRVHTNRGVGNDQGDNPVVVSSDIAYTRTKRSNVLTFNPVTDTVENYNSGAGETFTAGDVVELLPAHGQIMKGYASQIDGADVAGLAEVMRKCLLTYGESAIA